LYGGIALIADSTGGILQMSVSSLEKTPFNNFLIPGLILFFLLGLLPGFLLYPLLFKPEWKWANFFNIYKDQHWVLTYCLYLGIILIVWIDIQIMLVGYGAIIQSVYAFIGVAVVILSVLPGVKNNYKLEH
jgi:hypothetical protein